MFEFVDWGKLLRIGPVTASCNHGNGPLGFIKGGEFMDRLIYYNIFKKCFFTEVVSTAEVIWGGMG